MDLTWENLIWNLLLLKIDLSSVKWKQKLKRQLSSPFSWAQLLSLSLLFSLPATQAFRRGEEYGHYILVLCSFFILMFSLFSILGFPQAAFPSGHVHLLWGGVLDVGSTVWVCAVVLSISYREIPGPVPGAPPFLTLGFPSLSSQRYDHCSSHAANTLTATPSSDCDIGHYITEYL